MSVPTTIAEAREAAIRVGGDNVSARVRAYRRFRMLVEPHDGGFLGRDDRWHHENRYLTSITTQDQADLGWCVIEAEYDAAMAVSQPESMAAE